MGRYVYKGDQGDETWAGYTHSWCYINADTDQVIEFTDEREMASFERGNKIISWEEYYEIRDKRKYGQVIDNWLKFCLENRNWKYLIEETGLSIEDILNKCYLIENQKDYLLTKQYGIFPSRIFEVKRILESVLDKVQDEKDLNYLNRVIKYFKYQSDEILLDLAKNDLKNANRLEILKKIEDLYTSYILNSNLPFRSSKFKGILKDFILEFDAKEKGVISGDIISDLQSSKIPNRTLLSFYDYYDFDSLTRKGENNYPLYAGKSILECLVFEQIHYPHYVEWQNWRLNTGIENALVSPRTIRLLTDIHSDAILLRLIKIVKNMKGLEESLETPQNSQSRRLVLSDSFAQYDSNNIVIIK